MERRGENTCRAALRNGSAQNCILALLIMAVNILLMGIFFDFFYDLNDDTMMLDIMSGAYSGVPDGHNMQTLYPLGAAIALCYRACGAIPWYGIFLLLCQFGCFWLAGMRLCGLAGQIRIFGTDGKCRERDLSQKISLLLALSLFMWGLCLSHMVNIQYTVTSAVLSATAVFLFLTAPETDSARRFVWNNIPSVILVLIAYQLRSEMLLLTFPFICLAGLYRLAAEEKILARENLLKYGGVLGIILSGMLVLRGIDYAAYGSGEWKDFLRFFEARTTIYDFYPALITEDEYGEALSGLGVAPYQQTLLRNYNYGLDDEIDTELLTAVADYAVDTLRAAKDWGGIARKQVYRYYYRTFRGGDSPYSTVLLWMYAAVLVAGFCFRPGNGPQGTGAGTSESGRTGSCAVKERWIRRYAFLWQAALLAAVRTAIWMFILMRERDPERITHSLYLVEFALLAAVLIRIPGGDAASLRIGRTAHSMLRAMAVIFFLVIGGGVISGMSAVRENQEWRERVNKNWYAIDGYCRERSENFYLEDVYSTVSFSRRIFDDAGQGYANYDILGGWMCGSPLYHDKMGHYGIESVQKALLGQENVYLIMSDPEVLDQGFGWIEEYYDDAQGISVTAEKTDSIGDGYSVYQIVVKN